MSEPIVTVMGNVATDVRTRTTKRGVPVSSFRLACQGRRYDAASRRWVDDKPSFYNVVCWKSLAENVAECLKKGDPIVVHGRMNLKDWRDDAGRSGTDAEIDARSIGHDLMRGTSEFSRSRRKVEQADEDDALDSIRSEFRARRADEVLVDPETGEMYSVNQLSDEAPGGEPAGRADHGAGPEAAGPQPAAMAV
ncbi:MAG TPA: single-stranded DNA-binding protein [Jiangellaceae bacterium]